MSRHKKIIAIREALKDDHKALHNFNLMLTKANNLSKNGVEPRFDIDAIYQELVR